MSATLAITGSNLCGGAAFSVALAASGGVHQQSVPRGERGDLAALCRDVCRAAGLAADAITDVVVDVGPGSYTGLRVAVTFVRFLQSFAGVSVRAVDSLALLAHRALAGEADRAAVHVLLDARRGRFHVGRFRWQGGVLTELEPAQALATDAALARIHAEHTVVAPSGFAEQLTGQLAGTCGDVLPVPAVDATALLAPGLPSSPADAAALEPRYLMASYAED